MSQKLEQSPLEFYSYKKGFMIASHILVKYLHEAQDLEKALVRGKSFESLARKFSICASAEMGGWLGDLSQRAIDAEFKKALLQLQPNEISSPIKTKFGYHLIRREEKET